MSMRRVCCLASIVIVLLLSFGCVNSKTVPQGGDRTMETAQLWNLDGYPLNVFMGVSAPYSTTEKEIAEALYNCARSIAINEGLQVTSKLVSESSSNGLLSFATDGSALYSEKDVRIILERLELLEVRNAGREGVVIIASDPVKNAMARPYKQKFDSDGKPTWVHQLPTIDGYLVAVGETLGYAFVRDSLEASDVLAAEALIENSSAAITESKSYAMNIESEGSLGKGSYFQEGVLQVASGTLDGFVILARWYDSSNNHYYSLPASRKPATQK